MSSQGIKGEMTEVRRSGREVCLEWKIPRFIDLSGSYHYCESPRFTFCDGCWYLTVGPNWITRHTGRVDLAIHREDFGPSSKTVNFMVGIKVRSGGVAKRREAEREFKRDEACYVSEFCTREEIKDPRNGLTTNHALTITCEMRLPGFARGVFPYRDASIQTDGQFRQSGTLTGRNQALDKKDSSTQTVKETEEAEVPIDKNQSSEKQGGEKALEDFGKFFGSGENSDITVQVGDVAFQVHSFVLFARSPALSVSLRHQSREKSSGKIVVEDCEPDVFGEYLHYLYTGSVRSLTERNVFGLYRVADQYLADDLKTLCLKHIMDSLCIRTFCDAVKLALMHGESDLLKLALDFAAENIQSILMSVEWQNFICQYPREANEILIKSVRPRS